MGKTVWNRKGQTISISKGTPQGMKTSPILFEIYVDTVLEKLEELGVDSYSFFDDLIVIAPNEKKTKETILTLEEASQ